MKIRQGFVSNSSSSSFVIFGVSLKDHPELEEAGRKSNYEKLGDKDLPENTEFFWDEYAGHHYLGWNLGGGTIEDGEFGVQSVTSSELSAYSEKLKELTGIEPTLEGGITAG